jgi:hypothetical protein
MAIYSRDPKHKYRSALRQLVASEQDPNTNPLPLTHVTDAIWLQSILEQGKLSPRKCRVFGDLRLYAFYARPAYIGKKKGPLHNLNYAPVCFIIDAAVTASCHPVEVFPFDTGALQSGLLSDPVHTTLLPFDFALEPKVDSAQRLAKIFFGNDRAYYSGVPARDKNVKPRPTESEIIAYNDLIKRGGNEQRDERGTSIELHFKDPMPLSGKALAIMMPQEFYDDPDIRKAIDASKITPLCYTFIPDHTVAGVRGQFYFMAEAFYKKYKKQRGWSW